MDELSVLDLTIILSCMAPELNTIWLLSNIILFLLVVPIYNVLSATPLIPNPTTTFLTPETLLLYPTTIPLLNMYLLLEPTMILSEPYTGLVSGPPSPLPCWYGITNPLILVFGWLLSSKLLLIE